MHELSIAQNIVEIASAAAQEAGAERVEVVHLRVGVLAGLVEQALLFCFEVAAAGTPVAGARLAIEPAPAVAHCTDCGRDVLLAGTQHFHCPHCGRPTPRLISGRELDVLSIEIAD